MTMQTDTAEISGACWDGEHLACKNEPGSTWGWCVCGCHTLFGLKDAFGGPEDD